MPGAIGIDQQQQTDPQTTTDWLGNEAPVAFSSQPALPVAAPGGAGGGASTSTPTIGGSGVGVAPAPSEGGFGELAGAAMGEPITPGGDPGQASGGLGVATHGEGLPSASFDVGPFALTSDVLGNIGLNLNTDTPLDALVNNPATKSIASRLGVPLSQNVLSLVGRIVSTPQLLSAFGAAMGVAGLPMTVISLIDMVARAFPNTMVSQQGRAANMDIAELEQMTPQQLAELAFATTNPAQMSWTDPSFQIARHAEDAPFGVGVEPGAGTGAPGTGGVGAGGVGGPGDSGQAP